MTEMRDNFFEALCAYKNVDFRGKWKNNIGTSVNDKIEWLKSYKFNICFENSSYPGYLTEKLFDAFMGGCVPIYWEMSLRCGIDKECKETSNKDSKNILHRRFAQTIFLPTIISMTRIWILTLWGGEIWHI